MLGNGNGEWGGKTFINLKLVSVVWPCEKEDAPKFAVLGADFNETGESHNQVQGKLTKLTPSFTPAKGKMGDIFGFKAFIEDGEEVYVIESTITNASKDLLNSLVANIGEVLKINLYLNKNAYPTASVKLENGDWAKTLLPFNEIDNKKLFDAIPSADAKEEKGSDISATDIPF